MRANILCRERLDRILQLLDRREGTISLRDFTRTYGIYRWEIEQAAELGWLTITTRKPRTGRPSFSAKKLSNSVTAKLPPYRCQIPVQIHIMHWNYALKSISVTPAKGPLGLSLFTSVAAYLKSYPTARSYAGACASASRLNKRLEVRLLKYWLRNSSRFTPAKELPMNLIQLRKAIASMG